MIKDKFMGMNIYNKVMMRVVMMERAVAFGGRFHIVKRTLY